MNREANQKETTALDTSVGADVRQSLQNSTETSLSPCPKLTKNVKLKK